MQLSSEQTTKKLVELVRPHIFIYDVTGTHNGYRTFGKAPAWEMEVDGMDGKCGCNHARVRVKEFKPNQGQWKTLDLGLGIFFFCGFLEMCGVCGMVVGVVMRAVDTFSSIHRCSEWRYSPAGQDSWPNWTNLWSKKRKYLSIQLPFYFSVLGWKQNFFCLLFNKL